MKQQVTYFRPSTSPRIHHTRNVTMYAPPKQAAGLYFHFRSSRGRNQVLRVPPGTKHICLGSEALEMLDGNVYSNDSTYEKGSNLRTNRLSKQVEDDLRKYTQTPPSMSFDEIPYSDDLLMDTSLY